MNSEQRQVLSERDLRRLWDALDATVMRRFGGPVSLAKFLHQSDEHAAASYWQHLVAEFLAEVPEAAVRVARADTPTVLYPCAVGVSFDIGKATIAQHDIELWQVARRPLQASLVTDALGYARWGDAWAGAVADKARDTGRIVYADDDREFPWIAQNPPVPGPWTAAKTEELAVRAARAEALGPKKIAKLYERMRKRS